MAVRSPRFTPQRIAGRELAARVSSPTTIARHLGAPALLAALAAAVGCGSGANGPPPCDASLASMCGATCQSDIQCPTTQYCSGGHCTADCAPPTTTCSSGKQCLKGRCVDAVSTGDGALVSGDACANVTLQLDRQTPTLMLVLDGSGSMVTATFSDGLNRWQALRRTLVDGTDAVVPALAAQVRFGLAIYSSSNDPDAAEYRTCPMLTPPLPPALNLGTQIVTALRNHTPARDANTPTGESVDAAVRILARDMAPGTRALVLATDGEPDTCSDRNPNTTEGHDAARERSLTAVRNAFTMGFRTYVIGVGSDVGDAHLLALARAGAGGDTNATYIRALRADQLTTAFRQIATGVRSCTFDLRGQVDAAGAASGDVRLDGMQLRLNDANGWKLIAPNRIELQGTACERAKTSASTLTASFPCGVAVPG